VRCRDEQTKQMLLWILGRGVRTLDTLRRRCAPGRCEPTKDFQCVGEAGCPEAARQFGHDRDEARVRHNLATSTDSGQARACTARFLSAEGCRRTRPCDGSRLIEQIRRNRANNTRQLSSSPPKPDPRDLQAPGLHSAVGPLWRIPVAVATM